MLWIAWEMEERTLQLFIEIGVTACQLERNKDKQDWTNWH